MTLRVFLTKHRAKLLFGFAILLIVILGPYLTSRVSSSGRRVQVFESTSHQHETSGEAKATIRVLSYNIAHGRGPIDDNWAESGEAKYARIEEIGKLIASENADVVILNEVDFNSTWSGHQNQAEAIAVAANYPYRAEQRNLDFRLIYGSWKFGNAVLSRYPIVAAERVEYPAMNSQEAMLAGCKQGMVCTLQISETQQLRVVPVHLEHRSESARVASAGKIISTAEVSEIPLLALGDFNSAPTEFPHSQKTDGGENAMDLLLDSEKFDTKLDSPESATAMTYSTSQPSRTIDWVLIPAGWQFQEYRTIDSQLSDHRPVVADVILPSRE